MDLLLCREYKKDTDVSEDLLLLSSGSFLGRVLQIQILPANMCCSANFGINWQFVWTVQPVSQKNVQGRNAINALTQDFLPNYDKLLVALCPILESILPRTAPEQPNTARISFFSVGSTPHLAWKPKLHYPAHDFIWSHFTPLNTPTPYCCKIHFNIIIPEVACWFFHTRIFSLPPRAHTGGAGVVASATLSGSRFLRRPLGDAQCSGDTHHNINPCGGNTTLRARTRS